MKVIPFPIWGPLASDQIADRSHARSQHVAARELASTALVFRSSRTVCSRSKEYLMRGIVGTIVTVVVIVIVLRVLGVL